MLKVRIIPVMLWDTHGLVKGKQFNSQRRVGSVIPATKIYNSRDVDELILVDIRASQNGNSPRFEEVVQISSECLRIPSAELARARYLLPFRADRHLDRSDP